MCSSDLPRSVEFRTEIGSQGLAGARSRAPTRPPGLSGTPRPTPADIAPPPHTPLKSITQAHLRSTNKAGGSGSGGGNHPGAPAFHSAPRPLAYGRFRPVGRAETAPKARGSLTPPQDDGAQAGTRRASRTDLGAELNRSRRGIRPISANGRARDADRGAASWPKPPIDQAVVRNYC